ncbi:MAG: DUF429 domain-containing protein [Nostoc sp.]
MKFIGIDLGWRSQPSGLCCLESIDGQLQLLDLDRKEAIADILTWIDQSVQPHEPAIIAVDAPTLIPNATGSRLADKLSHKYFGKYHAGCYPANQNLPFAERTINFGLELESRGFVHAPTIEPQKLGRYQIEVFPHPASVNLFNLERILKYKPGSSKSMLYAIALMASFYLKEAQFLAIANFLEIFFRFVVSNMVLISIPNRDFSKFQAFQSLSGMRCFATQPSQYILRCNKFQSLSGIRCFATADL